MKQFSLLSILLVLVLGANSLRAQSINVVSPNGGENWYSFTSQTVTWTFTGMPPTVNILLSIDNMVTWTTIASGIPSSSMGGSHTITVPYANSNKCFIKVVNSMAPIEDVSDASFTIQPPTITVTSPNGGENWNIGGTYNITWNTTGPITAVDVGESRDNGGSWNIIQTNVPNGVGGGSYSWVIGGSASTQCLVQVRDFMYPPIGDTSNAVFTIMTPMSISNASFEQEPLKVYPNPTIDYISIETESGNYNMTISDMTGKHVVQSNVSVSGGIITINFSELPKGMYILRLQNTHSNKVCLQKIEKM